jgi:uncharacterized protein YggU (UPF0235/DUF167 family)
LIVSVREPAVDGRATGAVLIAVAEAFGIDRGDVRLVAGASSRTKILELTGEPPDLVACRERLLADEG